MNEAVNIFTYMTQRAKKDGVSSAIDVMLSNGVTEDQVKRILESHDPLIQEVIKDKFTYEVTPLADPSLRKGRIQ